MTRHRKASIEAATTLFFDDVGDDLGGVPVRLLANTDSKAVALAVADERLRRHYSRLASLLIPQNDLSAPGMPLVLRKLILQKGDILHQHVEMDAFLGRVDSKSANRESSDGSDVPRSATLSLDNEDSAPRGGSRLSDSIAVIDERVEASIGADRVLCAWNIVGDSGREHDHGYLESIVLLSCFP